MEQQQQELTPVAAPQQQDIAVASDTGSADMTSGLIRAAIDKDLDADKLEKLLRLYTEEAERRAKIAYAQAMNAAQSEMEPVRRDARNESTRSRFVRLETMHRKAYPIFTGHGFSLSHDEADSPVEGMTRYLCICRHVQGHSETYHVDLPLDDQGIHGKRNKTAVHAKVSSGSYARRVLEARIFNIAFCDDDDDGNAAGGRKPEPTITPKQVSALVELLDEADKPHSQALEYAGVEEMEDIPVGAYNKLASRLRGLIKQQGGRP